MTLKRRHIFGLALLLGASAAMPANAKTTFSTVMPGSIAPVSQPFAQYAQAAISPSKAKSIAMRRVPGAKFVTISRNSGRYVVRLQKKNGQVVDVVIDAASGRVLN